MIKNCITDSTEIKTIVVDSLPSLTQDNYAYYDEVGGAMSKDLGVPKDLLINGLEFFFIHRWHKIDGEWYFFKSDNYDYHFVNELLGEIISEYFGLDTVHYQVAKLIVGNDEGTIGVISKNFCSPDYLYTRVFDYDLAAGDIRYLEELRSICQTDEEFRLLYGDFKKFMIRDFYTSQNDRSGNNFLFKEKKDGSTGKRLAELYDYECGFELYPRDFIHNQLIYQKMTEDFLRKYFKRDPEYQESLEKVRDANMEGFLNEVQERHSIIIPESMKKRYIEIDKEKKKIVKDNRLVKVLKPKHEKKIAG